MKVYLLWLKLLDIVRWFNKNSIFGIVLISCVGGGWVMEKICCWKLIIGLEFLYFECFLLKYIMNGLMDNLVFNIVEVKFCLNKFNFRFLIFKDNFGICLL